MSASFALATDPPATARALARCIACPGALDPRGACIGCGRVYPERAGILDAINPLSGRNRIAAAFYDGPGWPRFRPWERLFLLFQGGRFGARRTILRHLPKQAGTRILEVGIGDGENLGLLPPNATVYGVDIARTQLEACIHRFPETAGRLAWAEGETLPFEDATFDATYTVGGFNHFRDHTAVLREMRRVTRPGGTVIVADERPDLYRFSIGYVLGLPQFDRWALRRMGLDADFIDMAMNCDLDVGAVAAAELPGYRHFRIWNRLGYCLVAANPDTEVGNVGSSHERRGSLARHAETLEP